MLTLFDWMILGRTNDLVQQKLKLESQILELQRRQLLTPAERAAEDAALEAARARYARNNKIIAWTIVALVFVVGLIVLFNHTSPAPDAPVPAWAHTQPFATPTPPDTASRTPYTFSTPVPVVVNNHPSQPTQAELLDMGEKPAPRAQLVNTPTPTRSVVRHHPGAS